MSGSWGRGGDTKPSLTLTPFGRALGWGQPGVSLGQKGGERDRCRWGWEGLGGVICASVWATMSSLNAQLITLLCISMRARGSTGCSTAPAFPWACLPSSGSDQQVHLALGLHRSELIKSQTVKNFINSPSWSIYVESLHFSASRCSGCFQGLLSASEELMSNHGHLTCIQVPAPPWSHLHNQTVN